MKTKDLVKLEAELAGHWARGVAPVLERDSRGFFYLDEPVTDGYSVERGFIVGAVAKRTLHPKLIVFGLATVALLTAGFFALSGHSPSDGSVADSAAGTVEVSKKSGSIASADPVPDSPDQTKVPVQTATSCPLNWTQVRPLESATGSQNGIDIHLVRDIIIGGERQQTLTADCPTGPVTINVNFVKINAKWQEKGAVLAEPHP